MTTAFRSLPLHFALALALLALGGAAAADAPAAAKPKPEPKSIFADPEWRKHFMGTYGFLSGAEPEIGARERELLREVIDLLQANPRAAAARLAGEVGPQSSAALDFILANLQFQGGDLEAAVENYESALKKFPDFRRAHKNLGLLRVQRGELAAAITHLTRAVELGDRDGRNYGLLGYVHLDRGNFVAAESAYRNAILQQPETRDWQLGLARALLGMEKYAEAVAHFDSVLEAKPDDAAVWMSQANAYIGLERPMDAAVNLEAVRALGQAQPGSLALLGDIYMNAGMYDLARSAYEDVIRGDVSGGSFDVAFRAAELLVRTRAWDEAGRLLAAIDERYPKLATDDELRVLTLKAKRARGRGREGEAAKLLESIVERDGTRGDALLELADYYRTKGDTARALLWIERAEKLEAFERPALLAHAQLRVSTRDYAKAAELLRRALEIRHEPRVQQFLVRVEEAARG